MQFTVHVPSLMCEGCVEVVSQAILQKDSQVTIGVDLANKTLIINSDLTLDLLHSAIKEAGHTPVE